MRKSRLFRTPAVHAVSASRRRSGAPLEALASVTGRSEQDDGGAKRMPARRAGPGSRRITLECGILPSRLSASLRLPMPFRPSLLMLALVSALAPTRTMAQASAADAPLPQPELKLAPALVPPPLRGAPPPPGARAPRSAPSQAL